jgi:hypothetical protein
MSVVTYVWVGMTIKVIKLGPYSLPNRRFAILLDQTKRIYNEIGEGYGNNNQIMSILGFKAKSESFYKNTEDLRAFCLIEGRAKEIKITSLALRAIGKDAIQKRVALEKTFDNFGLWKKLRERYNSSSDLNDFSQALTDITGANPSDEKTIESIKRSYLDDLQFLNDQLSELSAAEQDNQSKMVSAQRPVKKPISGITELNAHKNTIGFITYPEYSASPIQIKDELSYEIAQKLLEAIGKQLGIVKKNIQTSLQDD